MSNLLNDSLKETVRKISCHQQTSSVLPSNNSKIDAMLHLKSGSADLGTSSVFKPPEGNSKNLRLKLTNSIKDGFRSNKIQKFLEYVQRNRYSNNEIED